MKPMKINLQNTVICALFRYCSSLCPPSINLARSGQKDQKFISVSIAVQDIAAKPMYPPHLNKGHSFWEAMQQSVESALNNSGCM